MTKQNNGKNVNTIKGTAMNVINFDPKAKEENRRKEEMLEVLDKMRQQVEDGLVREMVACSMTDDGTPQIHISCLDLAGGIGMFELGKYLLMVQLDE